MSSPQDKNAAPANQDGCFGKHGEHDTPGEPLQATESPQMTLTKAWMRCDPTARLYFLIDVRAGAPNLWREVERAWSTETGRRTK